MIKLELYTYPNGDIESAFIEAHGTDDHNKRVVFARSYAPLSIDKAERDARELGEALGQGVARVVYPVELEAA